MSSLIDNAAPPSFLGIGWSFPPEFSPTGEVQLTRDEADIRASLDVLFGTAPGERLFHPRYGLDLRPLLFEPLSTTTRNLLEDRIRTNLLIYEPRIKLLSLTLDDVSRGLEGTVLLRLSYEIRATNSRFNLVYPFNATDGNEHGSPAGRL